MSYYLKSVHKPARVSRFVALGLTTLKSVHTCAKVSRFVTPVQKVIINLQRLAVWLTLDSNTFIKSLATVQKVSVKLPALEDF